MSNFVKLIAVCVVLLLPMAPLMAQEPAGTTPAATGTGGALSGRTLIDLTPSFGAGLVTIGAAAGIGRLAASALESMARQPEVAGNIQTAMIISAALIEGFTFFALAICFLSIG